MYKGLYAFAAGVTFPNNLSFLRIPVSGGLGKALASILRTGEIVTSNGTVNIC